MDKEEKIAQVKEWLGTDDELQARALLDATEWNLSTCKAMLVESREVCCPQFHHALKFRYLGIKVS